MRKYNSIQVDLFTKEKLFPSKTLLSFLCRKISFWACKQVKNTRYRNRKANNNRTDWLGSSIHFFKTLQIEWKILVGKKNWQSKKQCLNEDETGFYKRLQENNSPLLVEAIVWSGWIHSNVEEWAKHREFKMSRK